MIILETMQQTSVLVMMGKYAFTTVIAIVYLTLELNSFMIMRNVNEQLEFKFLERLTAVKCVDMFHDQI